MRSGSWKFGQWKNVPIFFHWTILLWLPWYWWEQRSIVWAVVTLVAYLCLLIAHELGHAIVARSRQVKVFAIRLFALHGQCEYEVPYYEADDLFIAWGGVLAQLCVLALALMAKYSMRLLVPELEFFAGPLLFVFIQANIFIGAINLIPLAPLDGHKAWRAMPLVKRRFLLQASQAMCSIRRSLDFKKRKAVAVESQRVAAELLDRLRKK